MSNHNIRVAARPRADGVDLELLAVALPEMMKRMSKGELKRLAVQGEKLIAAAEEEVNRTKNEGAA